MRAQPLAADRASLTWQSAARAVAYRLYSDMGTGLGVYLFKAQMEQPSFTDTDLRPSTRYRYHVAVLTRKGEAPLADATVVTPRLAVPPNAGDLAAPAEPTRVAIEVTPAPTPLPPDTVILGLLSASDHVDEVDGSLVIVGEVRNDSNLDVGDTAVTATFYGADGQKSGEIGGDTTLSVLTAGALSPFVIKVQQSAPNAHYSLRATGRPSGSGPGEAPLKVVSTRRYEDDAGFYHVAGVIEHVGSRRVDQARVVVVLYDRGGGVVNVGFAYPKPAALSHGDRADFDVAFTYYPKVMSHAAIALAE